MTSLLETKSPGPFGDPSLLLLHEDVGETYEKLARSAALAVGAETCQLALYDATTGEVIAQRPRYSAVSQAVPQYRFRPSPASARVIETGEPHLTNDPGNDPLYEPSVRERGVSSVLTVPVRRGNRILGLLYALNKPGGFAAEDAQTLLALAGGAAVTLENVHLYAEERERRLLNEGLREVSRALVSTTSEDVALGSVLDQIFRVIRYRAALAVVREGERLRVAASRGGDPGLDLPLKSVPELRDALLTRQPTLLSGESIRLGALGLPGVDGRCLVAPLLTRSRVLGGLVVVFDVDQAINGRETRLVGALADHASLFLEAGGVLRHEREARDRAAAVARITRLAVTRHEPDSLLQAIAPEVLSLSGADRVVVYECPGRGESLAPAAEAGAAAGEDELVRAHRLAPGSLVERLSQNGPLVLTGAECEGVSPFPRAGALVLVPMASRDQLLGVMLFARLGRPAGFDPELVDVLHDVAQQVALGVENARLFTALSQMASTDELTDLANRRRFSESLRLELARSRREVTPVSLILADVDHLKRINDSHGHPAGDAAIRHVAAAFKMARRETDMAARLGGEEFALLLPGTGLAGAVKLAEMIRAHLDAGPLPGVGRVTVSLGVATCPDDGVDEEEIVRTADARLYTAKAAGRNRVCWQSPQNSPFPELGRYAEDADLGSQG